MTSSAARAALTGPRPVRAVGRAELRLAVLGRVGLRFAVLGGVAVLLAAVHVHRPATICPLRALTGLPCPFCGGTTAAVDAGRLDPLAAARANPLVVAGAGLVALAPAGIGTRWAALSPRTRAAVVVTAVCGAELWQLVRFGVLPS